MMMIIVSIKERGSTIATSIVITMKLELEPPTEININNMMGLINTLSGTN